MGHALEKKPLGRWVYPPRTHSFERRPEAKRASGRLRARAAGLIRQLDAGAGYRDQIERDLAKRLAVTVGTKDVAAAVGNFCTQCGTKNEGDARFCKNCGQKL